ncbi:MAG: hypothetical protein [Caudoviricetes sp.]|nr:MAG: hypothetical protein [Caudoviricetes sp.]
MLTKSFSCIVQIKMSLANQIINYRKLFFQRLDKGKLVRRFLSLEEDTFTTLALNLKIILRLKKKKKHKLLLSTLEKHTKSKKFKNRKKTPKTFN